MKKLITLAVMAVMFSAMSFAQTTVKYQGEVSGGFSIGVGKNAYNRITLHTIQGAKIGDYFSTGLGCGLDWYHGLYPEYWEKQGKADAGELVMPIYLNLKGYLPVESEVKPFLSFDVGYALGLTAGVSGLGGFYCTPAIGCIFKKFKAEVGVNLQNASGLVTSPAIKLAVGYVF